MKDLTEGYQIIALGDEKYLRMAEACAASIRALGDERAIQVITNHVVWAEGLVSLFDVVTPFRHGEGLFGPLAKLKCHEYRVFDHTLFVDCDCIFFESIDKYWDAFRALQSPVSVVGVAPRGANPFR